MKLQGRLLTIWPAGDRQNIARGTWCYGEAKNIIYILSFFIKKTQKTDPKDIQTAINRKKDMISWYQRGALAGKK